MNNNNDSTSSEDTPEAERPAVPTMQDMLDKRQHEKSLRRGCVDGVESVEDAVKDLESKLRILPRVEYDGSSDCPFAETLYAQKEAAEKKLVERLNFLLERKRAIEHEIEERAKKLNIVRTYEPRINGTQVKGEYSSAESAAREKLEDAQRLHREMGKVIERAQALLQQARSKKYPGKEPRMPLEPPMHLAGSSYPPGGQGGIREKSPTAAPDNKEIDDLFSTGPQII